MLFTKFYRPDGLNWECFYLCLKNVDDQIDQQLADILQAEHQDNVIHTNYLEIGPRLGMTSPWSGNTLSILHRLGLTMVTKIERSVLYHLTTDQ